MLNDFDFCSYTRCVFGKDAERKAGKLLLEDGAKKVLVIHDDGAFLKESGILTNVFQDLTDAGLEYVDFGGVRPCPLRSHCVKGIETYRNEGCNYLLAVGGGSAIDTAKAIAAGVTYDGDFNDMFSQDIGVDVSRKPHVAVIVTIASTGSETGFACIIYDDTKPGLQFGSGIRATGNLLRPEIAFMNPALTATVPPYQTACGIVDMFGHVCERYITVIDYGVVDYLAEGLMRSIVDFGQKVIRNPGDLEARGELLWAASLAHNDTVGVGRNKDFGAHSVGGAFGPLFGTVHGATISVVMASWMRHIYKQHIDRFVRYAVEVWHVENDPANPDRVALEGIARTEQFFRCIGAPTNFKEAGIPMDNIEEIAKYAGGGRVIKLGYDDVLSILWAAAGMK